MSYNPHSIAFHQDQYRPLAECHVNIMTHALQYGTMVFGGMRGYYNIEDNDIYIFRIEEHFRRLHKSARIMQMDPGYREEKMAEILLEITRRNQYRSNVYYRPFVYKSALQLSPRLHDVEDSFSLYSLPLDDYLDMGRGLTTMVSSWRRIEDNIIPTRAKVSGGYANSALAKSEALQNGFDEAIFLDSRGMVSEGSAENIFMIRDGVLITPPVTASVLEGIVRKSIIQIARDQGLEVIERDIARAELYIADELFFTGTGAQVAWISEVDRRMIAEGHIGPITDKLRKIFLEIVTGKNQSYKSWVTAAYSTAAK